MAALDAHSRTVISSHELERIKMQTRDPKAPSSQLERNRLKQLSDERAQKWPNTIEALRAAKVSALGAVELLKAASERVGRRGENATVW